MWNANFAQQAPRGLGEHLLEVLERVLELDSPGRLAEVKEMLSGDSARIEEMRLGLVAEELSPEVEALTSPVDEAFHEACDEFQAALDALFGVCDGEDLAAAVREHVAAGEAALDRAQALAESVRSA